MQSLSNESRRYLDLLKRVLTNTISRDEPDWSESDQYRFLHSFISHYIQDDAYCMLPLLRLIHLEQLLAEIVANEISGDVLEAGIWRGGTAIFMRAVLECLGVKDRLVWVADSFEGLPEPDPERFPREAKVHFGSVMRETYQYFAVGLSEVQSNFERFGYLDENVRFLKGWFNSTLRSAPIEKLSLLRIDADYYSSTWDVLTALYDKVAMGGVIVIDDYGESTWTHCKEAVDDFRADRRIFEPIHAIDHSCIYWLKNSS